MINDLEYKLAESMEEKNAFYRLRFRGYCLELGWLNPANYPDGRETDEWDDVSYQFIAVEEGTVIGGLRLIPFKDGDFYTRQFVSIPEDVPKGNCLEVSRLYVKPSKRGRNAQIMFGLIELARKYSLERDVEYWYFLMGVTVEKILKYAGWKLYFLDERREIKLYEDSPSSLTVTAALLHLRDKSICFRYSQGV